MNTLERLFRAGRTYAVVSEITRDPDPAPDHEYDRSPQSGAGNCRCGAAEHYRLHPHEFWGADSDPSHCVCGLQATARCHTPSPSVSSPEGAAAEGGA